MIVNEPKRKILEGKESLQVKAERIFKDTMATLRVEYRKDYEDFTSDMINTSVIHRLSAKNEEHVSTQVLNCILNSILPSKRRFNSNDLKLNIITDEQFKFNNKLFDLVESSVKNQIKLNKSLDIRNLRKECSEPINEKLLVGWVYKKDDKAKIIEVIPKDSNSIQALKKELQELGYGVKAITSQDVYNFISDKTRKQYKKHITTYPWDALMPSQYLWTKDQLDSYYGSGDSYQKHQQNQNNKQANKLARKGKIADEFQSDIFDNDFGN